MKKQNNSRKVIAESRKLSRKRLLNADSPFAIKEAYVKLRTSLMFCMTQDGSRPCKVFEITSSNPSEGKSMTAANIAISFAMLGKKTLLIDADMRKPTQKSLWNAKIDSGLCDFLARIGPLEYLDVEGLPLRIICTGTIPPNPSELLASGRMKVFVSEFAKRYDYVIIDTPPINTVADAQIISTFVDGVVLVVKSAVSKTEELKNAVDAVTRAGGNLCGLVLNDMNLKSVKYSKYKYGKYEYAYQYSYSAQKE